jgi:hypothetical protein
MYSNRDTLWINELERMDQLSQNAMRERVDYLEYSVLYVNCDNVLESTATGVLTFDESCSVGNSCILRKERLLKLISQYSKRKCKRKCNHVRDISDSTAAVEQYEDVKYACKELSLFWVDVEPEQLDYLSQVSEEGLKESGYWKTFSLLDNDGDVTLSPSIFIFHSLNRLYLTFVESISLKSCLKNSTHKIGKMTKRVRMKLPRTTRKHVV